MIKINSEQKKTTQEMIDEFMNFKTLQGISDLTLRDYNKTFNQWKEFNYDYMEFLKSKQGGSPAKFNIPYSNLNAFYNWCIRLEYYPSNPLTKTGLKKVKDDGKVRTISINEIKKLIKVIDINTYAGIRDYTIIMLILDCGIRPKEVFNLKIENFNDNIIEIDKYTSKTRKRRIVPISKLVINNIKKVLALKPTEWKNDFIFCSYDGEQMHSIMFSKRLYIYSEKAAVKVTPYDLRHTFATMYIQNSGNVFSLQSIMGHSDIRMTKRYISISEEQLIKEHITASPLNNIISRSRKRIDKI